jgi:hypothetical protein
LKNVTDILSGVGQFLHILGLAVLAVLGVAAYILLLMGVYTWRWLWKRGFAPKPVVALDSPS